MIEGLRCGEFARRVSMSAFGSSSSGWAPAIARVVREIAKELDEADREFRNLEAAHSLPVRLPPSEVSTNSNIAATWAARADSLNGFGDVPALASSMADAVVRYDKHLAAIAAFRFAVPEWRRLERFRDRFPAIDGNNAVGALAEIAESLDTMRDALPGIRAKR